MIPLMVGAGFFILADMALAGLGIMASPGDVEAQAYLDGNMNGADAGPANGKDTQTRAGWGPGKGWGPGNGWGGTVSGTNPDTFNTVSPADMEVRAFHSGNMDAGLANGNGTQTRAGWGPGKGWGPGNGWGGTVSGTNPDKNAKTDGGTFASQGYRGGWVREDARIEQHWGLPKADLKPERMVMESSWHR
jgi:hypothetical protein